MLADYIAIVLSNLRYKRLRTALTMIGIFIGIAAVVALISVGQGMQRVIDVQFEKIGANTIIISGGGFTSGPPGSSSTKITQSDVELIKKTLGVERVTYLAFKTSRVEYNDKVAYPYIIGLPVDADSDLLYSMQADVTNGRRLKQGDRYKALAGDRLFNNNDLFGEKVSLGSKIMIENKAFEVVGSLEKVGNSADDSMIYIPLDTAKEMYKLSSEVTYIYAQASPGADVKDVAERVKKVLRKERGEIKGEESFEIQTAEQLIETFNTVFSVVTWVLVGIAAISLIVGGIGIMNTMYTSILERTRDIGIMKAIGAAKKDILAIFLFEAGFLGMAGGIIGTLIGMGVSKLIGVIGSIALGTDYLQPSFPLYLILGALAFSFLVGTIAGMLPAIRAANLHPVDALQYRK